MMDQFMPHGHCYLWQPALVWTHVISDVLIGLAYMSISISLYMLIKKIRVPFSAVFVAFGIFIGACGMTHFMEAWNLWHANYWTAGALKLLTAAASVTTAGWLYHLAPNIFEYAKMAQRAASQRFELARYADDLEKANLQLKNEIEERKRMEEALHLVNRELEAFSYSVSHDLRGPLRGVDGFSQALLEDYSEQIDAEGKKYLQFIKQGAQTMQILIDDLLKLGRINRTELNISRFNISELSTQILNNLRKLEPSGRSISVQVQPDLYVDGDKGLLALMLENLFSNALKYTSKKNLTQIEFGRLEKDGQNVFFVRDNGAGFSMTSYEKLFAPFQRLHSPKDFQGTGVGLATVRRIILRHHGDIWATAVPEEGATFYFALGRREQITQSTPIQ